jgi:sodium/bile acid cotransporter 7
MNNEKKWAKIEAVYARSRRLFPEVPELTVEELDRLSSSTPVILVDVRAEKEQEVSMIPGAVSAQEFERFSDRYTGKTVVAYCTVGHRSGLYVKKLLVQGWQAFNLKGAILAWTHADRELVDQHGPTRRVHVAGSKWSFEADGYDPIW